MDGKFFGLGRPIITVVQPTQSIMGNHATRGYVASSAPWRSLAQPEVPAVFLMVGDVLGEQPSQVPLVESNHMVQQLAAAAPGPTFGDTILPGTFERGPHVVYLEGSNGCRDLGPVFCVPVKDEKSGSCLERKRLPQLLDDLTACRMLRDAEMQDTPAIVAHDKEAVEDTKADRGHGEEVHGRNRFPVIPKKGAPALGWLGIPRNWLHPAGDASLGYLEAQHEQFAVNARRAPGRVLRHHTEDQLPNFRRQLFPADLFSRLRDPTPGSKIPS